MQHRGLRTASKKQGDVFGVLPTGGTDKSQAKPSQASKQPGPPAVVPHSADIGTILKPLYANIAYLEIRKQQVNDWLAALKRTVEVLESIK